MNPRLVRAAAAALCALSLASCTAPAPPETSETSETSPSLADAYSNVLDNPEAYEYNLTSGFEPAGTYSYALAEVTGDDSPELLLQADASDYWAPVTVFSMPESGALFNTQEVLISGAGSAGGGRAAVASSRSGSGLYQLTWQSVAQSVDVERFAVEDQSLVSAGAKTAVASGDVYADDRAEITWTPSTDRSVLDALESGTWAPPTSSPTPEASAVVKRCGAVPGQSVYTGTTETSCEFAIEVARAVIQSHGGPSFAVEARSPITKASYSMSCQSSGTEITCTGGNNAKVVLRAGEDPPAEASGLDVYEGTVVSMSTAEVLDGRPAPNNDNPNNEYIVLLFDSPQDVTAQRLGGESDTEQKALLALGDKEITPYGTSDETGPWLDYVGKRVRLKVDPTTMYFPSDASLPLGAPRVGEHTAYSIEVL